MRLAGKVALISGGARGMGASEAQLFVREGARVVIGDVLEAEGRAVEADIRAEGGEALFVRLDVTDEADWERAVARTIERFGKLDVLVNNAGVSAVGRIEDTTVKDWDRVMDVNAKGVFLGTRAVIPAMRQARRRLDRQHLVPARSRRDRQQQPAVPGLQGRRAAPDEGDGDPVRARGHPRQLGAPRAHRDRHDRAAARRSGALPSACSRASRSAGSASPTRSPTACCTSRRTNPPSSPGASWSSTEDGRPSSPVGEMSPQRHPDADAARGPEIRPDKPRLERPERRPGIGLAPDTREIAVRTRTARHVSAVRRRRPFRRENGGQ